jgi:uncharacterized protein
MLLPKNGLYFTKQDFLEWQDYFADIYGGIKRKVCNCDCGSCDKSTTVKTVTLSITHQCQLRCKYCYEANKNSEHMTKEIATQAIDFLFDKTKMDGYIDDKVTPGIILEFIGGEPLLEIDLINYATEYFKFKAFEKDSPWASNYRFSISTNGIMYNDRKVQDFLERNRGMVSVTISIDGNKQLHDSARVFPDGTGSYDMVCKAVESWVRYDDKAQTKMTLSPYNITYLNDAVKNLWGLGVQVFCNCVFEEGWQPEHATILYNQLKELADYIIDNKLYDKHYISMFDETIGQPLVEDTNWCGGNGNMLAIGTDDIAFML